ncbi:MAG: DUF3024 domain-containing protein [Opitutaceae bacterium]|nr:DUF3024 domain-containing protein [Opitutaceae bacterium]
MSFSPDHIAEVLRQLGRFIESIRPKPEIRDQLDFRADIQGAEVFLSEVRPMFQNPGETQAHAFAKIRWFKFRKMWKLYWMRASGKWELYAPEAYYFDLEKALKAIAKDKHGCFFG